MHGKGHLEDVPDAPNIPQVGGGESGVKALLVCTDSGVVQYLYSCQLSHING